MLFVVQFEDVYGEQPYRLPERAQHTSYAGIWVTP